MWWQHLKNTFSMKRKKDIIRHSDNFIPRPNGQEWKTQRVQTPYGFINVLGNTRVLPLTASKKDWNEWFKAFVKNRALNEEGEITYKKWVESNT